MILKVSIEEITHQIEKSEKARPILIALDGYGGSGKTTIAEKLKVALGDAYVVSIDDFIVKERLLEASADAVMFDRERLVRQVLAPLREGRPAAYQKLEWETNQLGAPIAVPPVSHVIMEGISSTHPDIAAYFDYKIWVDVPINIAKQRGKNRDAGNENEQHWDLWAQNDIAYQAAYQPEKQADFIIKNDTTL